MSFEKSTYSENTLEEQTVVSLGMNDMKNPVPLVTSKLAELFKRDVDFRTTKAEPKKTRRFFIKIGKLEISRNVYSEDELAIK